MNPAMRARKQRIKQFLNTIREKPDGIDLNELIAKVVYLTGLVQRTIKDYLEVLLNAGLVMYDQATGKVYPVAQESEP